MPDKSKIVPDKVLEAVNLKEENIRLWLKGAQKEWLLCTDVQVYIVKKGFMTGHTFGFGIFQMPYKNIAGANVNFHFLTGYFEISSGGMQNTQKNYWSSDKNSDPLKAPNCISISGKDMAEKFRNACDFILNRVHSTGNMNATIEDDIPMKIKKLAELRRQGILTESEFVKKKAELLAKM